MLSVFVIIMVSWMLFLLSTFDKPPEYLVDRLLYITLGTPNTNTFLPSYYYEDLDVLPYIYSNHVKTLEDFYKWKSGPVLEEYRKRPTLHQVYHDNITRIFNEERDGYTLSKYTMPTSYPDDVIFYRLTPYSNLTDGGSAVLVIPVVLSNDPQYFSSGRWHRIGYKKIDMGPVHSIVSCRYDAPLGCG